MQMYSSIRGFFFFFFWSSSFCIFNTCDNATSDARCENNAHPRQTLERTHIHLCCAIIMQQRSLLKHIMLLKSISPADASQPTPAYRLQTADCVPASSPISSSTTSQASGEIKSREYVERCPSAEPLHESINQSQVTQGEKERERERVSTLSMVDFQEICSSDSQRQN